MDAEVMDNAKIAKLVARGSLGYNPERCNPRRCDPRQARRPLPAHQNAADGQEPSKQGTYNTDQRSMLWRK